MRRSYPKKGQQLGCECICEAVWRVEPVLGSGLVDYLLAVHGGWDSGRHCGVSAVVE